MTGIKITVWGKPIAQARPRFRIMKTRAGKQFGMAYSTQETDAGRFAHAVAEQLPAGFVPFEGAVALSVRCVVPIPASASKKKRAAMAAGEIMPIGKPDLDNCVKFIKDALKRVIWFDDSQVCRYCEPFEKIYGNMPRTEITVFQIEAANEKEADGCQRTRNDARSSSSASAPGAAIATG